MRPATSKGCVGVHLHVCRESARFVPPARGFRQSELPAGAPAAAPPPALGASGGAGSGCPRPGRRRPYGTSTRRSGRDGQRPRRSGRRWPRRRAGRVAVAAGVHQEGQGLDRARPPSPPAPSGRDSRCRASRAATRAAGVSAASAPVRRKATPSQDPPASRARTRPGLSVAAAKPPLQQAEAAMIPVDRADPPLGRCEFRLPDKRTVTEHPEALRRHRPGRQGGGEAGGQLRIGHQGECRGVVGHRDRMRAGDEIEAEGEGGVGHGANEPSCVAGRKPGRLRAFQPPACRVRGTARCGCPRRSPRPRRGC